VIVAAGANHTVSEETRINQRRAHLGKTIPAEQRVLMSKSHTGNKNHFFGKKHSEESRRKMRLSRLNFLERQSQNGD
jgi:hypothetical protein